MIISLLVLVVYASCSVLSTADFTGLITSSDYYVFGNPIGVTFDLPDLLPYLSSDLLQRYLLNSQLQGSWSNIFEQTVHVPPGYKYNCSNLAALTNTSANCTFDLNSQTFMTTLGNFIYNTTNWYAFNLGWDQQDATFTTDYTSKGFLPFIKALYNAAKQPFNIEFADKANLYAQNGIRPNYTAALFVQDCNTINNVIYGLTMSGPGTTDTADSSWYSINKNIYYYCGFFTLRAVVFPNPSDLTIANLLSEKYTSEFLKRRMTADGTSYLGDFSAYLGSISDLRLVEDPMGVPGLTDSFAACIWAVQFTMEFFFISGFRIDFYSTFLAGSKQGIFGTSPTLAPTGMYSALLLVDLALAQGPYIDQTVVKSGTSGSIRVYGLDNYGNYGVLLLNKDTNSSHSGDVSVKIRDPSGLYCIYLTAASLTATSGFTIGGLKFVANQSQPLGNYTEFKFVVGENGYYQIPLNYSQVAYCETRSDFSYNPLPTSTATGNTQFALHGTLFILFLLIFISL